MQIEMKLEHRQEIAEYLLGVLNVQPCALFALFGLMRIRFRSAMINPITFISRL
jgi:hypothetical protein